MTDIITATAAVIDRSNSLPDLAARIRSYHEATIAALRSSVESAMNAGDLLIEAKAQLKHGQWLPWLTKHCPGISERSVQLYTKLAKNRATIEKHMKSATVADLTLNEAAALCVLAGRLERLMEFAKRAEGSSPDQIVDLCIAEGFDVIKDESYDPFLNCSEAEIREWILFAFFIGRGSPGAFSHAEWILQRQFKSVDEWLGAEGKKFRQPYGWRDSSPKFHTRWAKFKTKYADKTRADIAAEILAFMEKEGLGPPFLLSYTPPPAEGRAP